MQEFTLEERKKLERMYNREHLSFRAMGRVLGRFHTSIRYEILTNSSPHYGYDAERAHYYHLSRIQKRGNKSKIEQHSNLKSKIIELLKEDYSPEQIAGSIKRDHQEEVECLISTETIYAWIYSVENKENRYFLYLRRHRPKRKKYCSRSTRKHSSIPKRTSIHERPKEIDEKQEFGHWESDLIIFSKQKQVISVEVERVTRKVVLYLCDDKTAKEKLNALVYMTETVGKENVHTITFDNGTENVLHYELYETFEYIIDNYFCDSYCSWQKGAVENMNMFIRQYLPRYTDLAKLTQHDIYIIQEKLNNRPRKCLNFTTPNRMFDALAKSGQIKP